MSKLFVGQLVKIVGTEGPPGHRPPPTGKAGVIVWKGAKGQTTGKDYEWEVLVEEFGLVQCDSIEIQPMWPEGSKRANYLSTTDGRTEKD